ncbi:uncharacterized protein MYCGRDRAFT_110483 [Zymoseptoria tritici IPO323]|uniref:Xylanolytic transcriptional activator regulatory domain-containing protein n=1 Tax=Zymoseptoria tritici (strain CBS 115943 / IPO323) TaxID=336722 RepID=F9XHX2_ZYMTI|nr:uncharacterized protein MYCGRDRAFT_110483 [Zymoseptoria tritici IPO323]EGP85337.1 hypothetical protein MYCGRDRAFT_110483 [Zymoseptoria tritici IPO323]
MFRTPNASAYIIRGTLPSWLSLLHRLVPGNRNGLGIYYTHGTRQTSKWKASELRCVRRGAVNLCYYHPAPLTKSTPSILPSPATTSIVSARTSVAPPQDSPAALPQDGNAARRTGTRAESAPATDRFQGILSVPSAGILMEPSDRTRIPEFLGHSSSSAVVAELNDTLGIDAAPEVAPETPLVECIPESAIRQGIEVLSFFQDAEQIRNLVDRCFESGDGEAFLIYRPIYYAWLDHMLPLITEATRTHSLAKLSALTWRNTQRPLVADGALSAIDWALRATGEHLRWESVGLLLSLIGMLFGFLQLHDPALRSYSKIGRARLLDKQVHLIDICIDFSKRCGSRNDLMVCLLYDRMLVVSFIRGDTSIEVWTSLSAAFDAIVLAGIHLEKRVDVHTPFFLCELRIRLFLICFSMDKFLATFMGRPPHLSYRYSVLQQPHELSDDELCSHEADLQAALVKSDVGVLKSGPPTRMTWRRIQWQRPVIREDILEIAIGTKYQNLHDLQDRIRGGVLAMEMLKRDQKQISNAGYSRSEILQQLSVLVAALEAVSSEESNYAICAMGLNAIKKVLDRVLSRPAPRATEVETMQPDTWVDPFQVYIDNDADFLQWLNSVEFQADGTIEPALLS